MTEIDASRSGTFAIGGDTTVNRLGFGAMRITDPGVWGEPKDRDKALRVLRRLPEISVNFVDTADSYGPSVSEELIAEALHPYDGLIIATKVWSRPISRQPEPVAADRRSALSSVMRPYEPAPPEGRSHRSLAAPSH